jgi:hypothetical protein
MIFLCAYRLCQGRLLEAESLVKILDIKTTTGLQAIVDQTFPYIY